ncbi:MAG: hypothetical protein KQH79_10485 [Bacteroidetes bacterium]|nr:hypothetical protein [Bacteroidota bacterium]
MRKLTFFLATVFIAISCSNQPVPTPLEESNFTHLTANRQLVNYLDKISKKSHEITYSILGITDNNRQIPLVVLKTPDSLKKPTILIIAQQHGNEPSGKEGMLLLLKDFASGKYTDWLSKFDIYILPQLNPDGGDQNQRRNAGNIDLNRDHLILNSDEAKIAQDLFDTLRPIVTVDFHEYYPFSQTWTEFGYRKNFDIQFGGLTNINIDSTIRNYFYDQVFPDVESYVKTEGYSFFEYTLGNYALGTRLRHSTVDINDGRQSFGICNTLSFIVEGMNGKDSINRIQRRALSQYQTAKGILNSVYQNFDRVYEIVTTAREKNFIPDSTETVSIRMDHFKDDSSLNYPLLSLKTGKDTVFKVEEFHSEVKSLLNVKVPRAYLIPKSDTLLANWLIRSNFDFDTYNLTETDKIYAYKIVDLMRSTDEELENYYPKVEKVSVPNIDSKEYYIVHTNQFYKYKVVTALEPQAMYGLINYPDFEYLLHNDMYKILRLEY